ncbi:hypothetical protein GWK47_027515 [Chionoecetes opilio]|uniref:Uncharacterized protein n=1 Tax=Chionoecetes opilio TaxID=41210 RepID=A0A8J8WBZ2_CHIOP|nr:hypothetical protein GWK47_027515 [Chionoecetes opilio]
MQRVDMYLFFALPPLQRTLQIIPRKSKAEEGPRKLPVRAKVHSILPKPVAVPSYGICWGGVECPGSRTQDSIGLSLSQAYSIKNRVPFLMMYKDDAVRCADNLPFEEFVPDSEDFIRVRNQMKKEVQKILIHHLEVFAGLPVDEGHRYSAYVRNKSQMVRLMVGGGKQL